MMPLLHILSRRAYRQRRAHLATQPKASVREFGSANRSAERTMKRVLLLFTLLTACHEDPPPLDDMGTVPPWQLTDQTGKPLGSAALAGKPYIANFLFTSCPTSCPPLARATTQLQALLRAWQPKTGAPLVRIVSISVDPETDTPQRLTEWAKDYSQDPRLWSLVTGPYEAMETLVVGGFMQPLLRKDRQPGEAPPQTPTPIDTAHSLRFVLVDGRGHIRGLYEKDAAALAKLDADVHALAEAKHD